MTRALVLNATFEPLCIVSDRRAVVLVLGETAEMLHASDAMMHSPRFAVAVPSVVRLRRFVRVPYRWNTPLNRRSVFARDDHRCQYCGGPAESIDHVVPRSRGGDHAWENVVAACRPCNVRKRDRMLHETSMRLLRMPSVPRGSSWLTFCATPPPEADRMGDPARAAVGAGNARRSPSGPARSAKSGKQRVRPVTTPGSVWDLRRLTAPAADLHAEPFPDAPARAVWVLEATAPALVLGSTQSAELVDAEAAAAAGIELARRRSGGGAVLVMPGETAWVDVILPAGDPLWDDDIDRASHWLGRTWQSALAELGVASTEVHQGPLACGPLGRLVCFATVAAGEVTVPGGDGPRKVVGMSQRRTRAGARFQCAAYRRWDPEPLVRLLRLDDEGSRALADAAAGTDRDPVTLVNAFVRHLPA
jgi:lipoate---protein ligase